MDASTHGLGAMILAEACYPITTLQAIAIVSAIDYNQHYPHGRSCAYWRIPATASPTPWRIWRNIIMWLFIYWGNSTCPQLPVMSASKTLEGRADMGSDAFVFIMMAGIHTHEKQDGWGASCRGWSHSPLPSALCPGSRHHAENKPAKNLLSC